ncbi:MAG: hypothetical protein PQJ60_05400 [Spirochaetales bacterium]|nr:hypothetical protein [Spirochaetales bacterium]
MAQKLVSIVFMLIFTGAVLSAQSLELFEGTDLKNRDVETLDLGEAGKGKLKLGISLGTPMTGLTAGWQAGDTLELDLLVGSWGYDSVCLGGGLMISLLDIKISDEIFPLTVGPFVYTGLSSGDLLLSAGGVARVEYTFDFDLNLYVESGLTVNISQLSDNPLSPVFGLGARYIF